jgi:hypothetical protein
VLAALELCARARAAPHDEPVFTIQHNLLAETEVLGETSL